METPWTYKNNELHFDNIALSDFCEKVPTPFYLYSCRQLQDNFNLFTKEAQKQGLTRPLVCFALKANPKKELLETLASLGAGADIVSGGELRQALKCGIDPNKIVFSGVGKLDWEIKEALMTGTEGIYSFNVESEEELEDIIAIAKELGRTARIAIRLNPKVNAKTHKHISTGYKTHKFGILQEDALALFKKYKNEKAVQFMGLSVHIGSQLTCMEATEEALQKACSTFKMAQEILGAPLQFIDVGGGLGIDYSPEDRQVFTTPKRYMELIKNVIDGYFPDSTAPQIVFEPGRVLVARAGMLVTKVVRKKSSEGHEFIIVDGGMNDFVRTSLYEAYHEVLPGVLKGEKKENYDVVGPICETADCFARERSLPPLSKGDFLAVADTGAYGFSMASTYNLRELPREVVITPEGQWNIC